MDRRDFISLATGAAMTASRLAKAFPNSVLAAAHARHEEIEDLVKKTSLDNLFVGWIAKLSHRGKLASQPLKMSPIFASSSKVVFAATFTATKRTAVKIDSVHVFNESGKLLCVHRMPEDFDHVLDKSETVTVEIPCYF